MLEVISSTRFKQLLRERKEMPSRLTIQKSVDVHPVEVIGAGPERTLRFCCSTDAVDREQDKISQDGWKLDAFKRNPVVLFSHDASKLPIGRVRRIGVEKGRLMADVDFIPSDTPAGAGEFAEAVYRLCQPSQGFLAATSVGFRPLKWSYSEDKERGADGWFPGIDYSEIELVELSIVTVPANPEALIEEPGPGEGTAIAADTPPTSGEELTAFNEEQARARARLRRQLQLATARIGPALDPVPHVPPHKSAGARRRA